MRVQTVALIWSETLMDRHRLSCVLIDFERTQVFHESLDLPTLFTAGLSTTLVLVWLELMIVDES